MTAYYAATQLGSARLIRTFVSFYISSSFFLFEVYEAYVKSFKAISPDISIRLR